MSRKGKIPVTIPAGIKVQVQDTTVTVEGPKGKLKKAFSSSVSIVHESNTLAVAPAHESRLARAMHGTARSIIQNMVDGVKQGFSKNLEIVGVGFKAAVKGKMLDLALGYSHPINYPIPEGITITVNENTKLEVAGADKHLVGQVASDIKHFYPVEPYKGKGVRIVGEHVRRKEGKKTA